MIFEKFFAAIRAQLNKLANFFWKKDPVALMQYECDKAVEQLKEGRTGLELYRALVEKVGRQVATNQDQGTKLEARVKAYLKAGDRTTAARFALEMEKAKKQLAENQEQLEMHEGAYQNNLKKVQHANKQLIELRDKIQKFPGLAPRRKGRGGRIEPWPPGQRTKVPSGRNPPSVRRWRRGSQLAREP